MFLEATQIGTSVGWEFRVCTGEYVSILYTYILYIELAYQIIYRDL